MLGKTGADVSVKSEKEIKPPDQEKRRGDGAKAHPGKIYMPEARGEEKGGEERDTVAMRGIMKEEPRQEQKPQNRERSENRRRKPESEGGGTQNRHRKRLDVYEKAFPAVIFRIENLPAVSGESFKRVGAVHGLVGVESGRERSEITEKKKKRDCDYGDGQKQESCFF